MALQHRRPRHGLVHHSDRGCQYASSQYREQLHRHGLHPSIDRAANCYDNATMESFWSTLKQELVYRQKFLTRSRRPQPSSIISKHFTTRCGSTALWAPNHLCDFELQNN